MHSTSSSLIELYKMSPIPKTSYRKPLRTSHRWLAHLFEAPSYPIIDWMQRSISLDTPEWQSRIVRNSPRGCMNWNRGSWNDWSFNQPFKSAYAAWSWCSSLSKMRAFLGVHPLESLVSQCRACEVDIRIDRSWFMLR